MKKVWTLLALLCLLLGLCVALASCGETTCTEHQWDNGKVTKAATCTTAGSKTFTCTVCGEEKKEEIAAMGHDFSATYTVSEDGKEHWQQCTRCSEVQNRGKCKFVADPENSVAPTCNEDGVNALKCEVCGQKRTTVAKATGEHTAGTEVKYDEKGHWNECTKCGYVMNYAAHDLERGTEPTFTADSCQPGERTDVCKECDYEVTVSVDSPTDHQFTWNLDTTEKTLTATCSACHTVRNMTFRFGDDFSDEFYTLGKDLNYAYDGSGTFSPASFVEEDENGNRFGEFHKNATDGAKFNHEVSFAQKDPSVYLYEAISVRVQLSFTGADGNVHGIKTDGSGGLEMTPKINGVWNCGMFLRVTNNNGKLCLGGFQTDIAIETDKWLTITYIFPTGKSKGVAMASTEDGQIAVGEVDIFIFDPSIVPTTLNYWAIDVEQTDEAFRLDDIMYFCMKNVEKHAHSWDDGRVTKEPDCRPGEMTYTCTVCGMTKTEEITEGVVDHKSDNVLHYNETENPGKHWNLCEYCGMMMNEAEHTLREDKDRREDEMTWVVCTDGCGYEKQMPLSDVHHPADEWSYDDAQHWHACTDDDCGEKLDLADHEWELTDTITPATCQAAGTGTYTCKTCGKTKEDEIAKVDHAYKYVVGNKTLTKVCESGNETAETFTLYENASFDFEDGNSPVGTVIDLDGNKVLEMSNGANRWRLEGVHGEADGNKVHKGMAFSFRIQLSYTDGDTVHAFKDFELTPKCDGWGKGCMQYHLTNENGKINLAGVSTGMDVEADKWYTITYVLYNDASSMIVMITNEAGVTVMGTSPCSSMVGAETFNFWTLTEEKGNSYRLDDIQEFYLD